MGSTQLLALGHVLSPRLLLGRVDAQLVGVRLGALLLEQSREALRHQVAHRARGLVRLL